MDVRPSKASILGALSLALDLVEGQPEGHALRTAQIGLFIANNLGLDEQSKADLFFATVLKDSGCSNNSVRIQKIFGGDEHLSKRAVKFIDWTSPTESIKFSWRHTESGQALATKLRRMAQNIAPPSQVMNEVTAARCTRGAEIARLLSFSRRVADAILYLDEHWNGRGSPYGIAGDKIPLLSRILCVAQTYEVFLTTYGPVEAERMVRSRSHKWFDPNVVAASLPIGTDQDFLTEIGDPSFVERELPQLAGSAIDSDLDGLCEAFAMIIDAKSSFTSEHSTRVMQYSIALGGELGLDKVRLSNLKRAALLHDIGKLGVPTGILEKPGRLEEAEFDRVKLHSMFGDQILRRIPSFEYMAEIASAHHERLDGKGYWRGLTGEQISLDVRIVTVCDVFDALSANRPYRDAMPVEQVWSILEGDIGSAFDGDCVTALKGTLSRNSHQLAA